MSQILEVFPDVRSFDADRDFYALGGDLRPELLLEAYRKGIFPWPDPDLPQLLWASPAQRGVLHFGRLHLSASLRKALRKNPYVITFNRVFEEVISMCRAVPRAGQQGTWITPELERAYGQFHRLGFAHSVEVWQGPRLVGGLYGVSVDGLFFAESMFHLEDNASKFALVKLVEHLQSRGLAWLDVQVLTPATEALGAELMSRADFLDLIVSSRNPGHLLWPQKNQS